MNVVDKVPYPFTFDDLCKVGEEKNLNLSEMALANEDYYRPLTKPLYRLTTSSRLWKIVLMRIFKRGPASRDSKVRRRAFFNLLEKLKTPSKNQRKDPLNVLDWVNLYALAVNEENASGAKIITAPTNGAAGIIPAVFTYYKKHTLINALKGFYDFSRVGIIGQLYMKKASISGAEVELPRGGRSRLFYGSGRSYSSSWWWQ